MNLTDLYQLVQESEAASNTAPRITGHVKWWNGRLGHGFVVPDSTDASNGRDIFIHHTGIEGKGRKDVHEGERVSFTLHDFGKGPQARNLRRLP